MGKRLREILQASYTDEDFRRVVVFEVLNALVAAVSLWMTVVNLLTGEKELMLVTAAFSAACMLNCIMAGSNTKAREIAFTLLSVEIVILLVYFVLGGRPQGFSALWTLLVPSLGLSVFGRKDGIKLSLLVMGMVTFFFWVPLGKSWLYYDYSPTFMLRFPFVYGCLFLASLYVETVRIGSYGKLKEMEARAKYLYRHDALTGLYTRYAFSEQLQEVFQTPSEHKTAVLVFDVDDFKDINDIYGHNAGDEALKRVAGFIMENICEHCMACRWGGEEFLVLMRCQHDPLEIAQKIRKIAEDTVIQIQDKKIRITMSAGVAVAETLSREQLSDFINCADKAMYESKAQGKNRVTFRAFTGK